MAKQNFIVRGGADFSEIEKKFQALEKKMKKWGKDLEKVGSTMSKAITVPVLGAAAASFKLASDMEESLNKVSVAFGNNARDVEAWSKTTLRAFGIAQGTALDMAALFGDMATAMGFNTAKAAEMSKALVGLAGDLASFKNIGIEEAQTALKSIFTGETESLKNLGIVMTQANLQQFALTQGIRKNIQNMQQAELVQLRYNYVMEMTKNAQGDFARTSGGAANQMRIFTESLKELGASFGSILLPVITPMITKINEVIQKFGSLDQGTKKMIVTVGLFAAAVGPVLMVTGSLLRNIRDIASAAKLLSVAFTTPIGQAALLASAIYILALMIVKVVNAWDKMTGLERVVTVLEGITIAALGAAIAVGAFQSALTMGIAAAAIVAGILAISATIKKAEARAKAFSASGNYTGQYESAVPRLASGAVIQPNSEFLAVLGDQRSGVNVEAPLDTIKQGLRDVLRERGGSGGNATVILQVDGRELARVTAPYNAGEENRLGVRLLNGVT